MLLKSYNGQPIPGTDQVTCKKGCIWGWMRHVFVELQHVGT